MHPRILIPALLLLAALGGTLASGAGDGTFTLSDATALVGQDGMTALVLDTTWDPPAADIWLNVRYDPDVIRYEGTRFMAGGTASATRTQAGTVLIQLIDTTVGFRSGTLAELTFSGLRNGSSALEVELQHVRAYPDGRPVEITDSAATVPGRFTVLASVPVDGTAVPTETPAPTPSVTLPPSLPTLPPVTARTPTAPPTTFLYGGDYTGAVSPTATPTPTPTGTASAPNRTIAEIAAANPDFSVFVNATRAAGLFGVLDGPGPLTAFVPTNAAFGALPPGTLDDLLANRTTLDLLLRYHLASGTLTVADVTARASVPTLLGVPLQVSVRPGGAVGIDGANLTLLDIPAANGMIHIVDGVLFPPGLEPALTPTTVATPPATTPPATPAPTTRAGPGTAIIAGEALAVITFVGLRRRR
jgi:uncharacterized surface protein with fasciclin (FAS1) repeats